MPLASALVHALGARLSAGHLGGVADFVGARYADRELVVGPTLLGRDRWTGRQLADTVARLGAAFARGGIRPGQTALVATDNRVDLLLHVLALARVGAIPAPASHHLKPTELAHVAAATGADAVVADSVTMGNLGESLPTGAPRLVADGGPGGFDVLGALRAGLPPAAAAPPRPATDVALLLCTSGTTGRPKAAALTSRGLLGAYGWLSLAPVGWQGRGPRAGRDTLLTGLPLAHVMGLGTAIAALHAGIRWLHLPRFDAHTALDLIEKERVNAFLGVPTMYADLEAAGIDARDVRSVQLWMSAADKMPSDRARRFQARSGIVRLRGRTLGVAAFLDIYGMVELSGPAAVRVLPPAPSVSLSPTLPYRLLPGLQVRAVDADGRVLGWGRTGTLQLRGPGVLRGYRAIEGAGPDARGWFSTGDQGRTWPGGLFAFSGRGRDRLKVSGFSVFPAEVEEALRGCRGVADLCIVGVPDPRTGERVTAVVVADEDFDEQRFLEDARARVQGYRRPRAVVTVAAIPRGKHDKVDREAATRLAQG
jgi:long-chain acyl-CoA synthetase